MRIFLASAYYAYRDLLAWLTPAAFLAQKLFLPFGQVAFFSLIGSYGGSQPLDFYLVGNAMLTAAGACVFLSMAISQERALGTLRYLLATPANRLALFFGRSSVYFLEATVWVLLAFFWAAVVFGLRIEMSTWPALLFVILVVTISAAGLGLFLGGLAYISLDVHIAMNGAVFLLLLLSGANVPRDELPGILNTLGQLLPLTRGIEAARLVTAGSPLPETWILLGGELAVGVAYALAGLLLFRWLEVRARRTGTLEGV